MKLTCIECPKGCLLTIEKTTLGVNVEGYDCLRENVLQKKVTNPTRTIASTVKTVLLKCQ